MYHKNMTYPKIQNSKEKKNWRGLCYTLLTFSRGFYASVLNSMICHGIVRFRIDWDANIGNFQKEFYDSNKIL